MIRVEKVESERSKKTCERETQCVSLWDTATIICCKYHNNVTNTDVLQRSHVRNSSQENTLI